MFSVEKRVDTGARPQHNCRGESGKLVKAGNGQGFWVKGEIPNFASLGNCDNITNSPANVNRFFSRPSASPTHAE
jgi:hypothetical protein